MNPEKKARREAVIGICTAVVVIIIVAVIIVLVNKNSRSEVEETESTVQTTEETTTEETTTEETTTEAAVEIPIDFEALWEQNPDIYAWIYIEDTPVDYPILQSDEDDPDYYLEHTVDYVEGLPGSIFTESNYNGTDMTDNVTIIYGHNMRNDTMFGILNEYQDSEYREEHSEIIIYTPENIFTYEIIFTVTYNNHRIPYYFDIDTEEGYAAFWESVTTEYYSPTWISDEYEFSTDDKMIVLSTCNGNSSQRYLVGAVLVSVQ